ncbi:4a-hydroxytetrahydrobiopterin dehydratase [Virgibacillus halodenitrificans]|uniref:4a-hydroxytetrahydrobiopterin dehydratase n=1 Tax=Virgibacillus halodenitrificans TaxID=1482 RepID=UPI001EED04D1|nr:4a-hydroxytetrahydrobiopterin dehydratase [Virgibacillus halodenitrificans]
MKYRTEDDYEMIPVTADRLTKELEKLPEWEQLDDKWIARQYKFDSYMDGVQFANQIAEYAEKRQHHPFIAIDYKKVTLKISSWRAKGVTELDLEMVRDFDEIYEKEKK